MTLFEQLLIILNQSPGYKSLPVYPQIGAQMRRTIHVQHAGTMKEVLFITACVVGEHSLFYMYCPFTPTRHHMMGVGSRQSYYSFMAMYPVIDYVPTMSENQLEQQMTTLSLVYRSATTDVGNVLVDDLTAEVKMLFETK